LILSYITGIDPVWRAPPRRSARTRRRSSGISSAAARTRLAMCFCLAFVQAFGVPRGPARSPAARRGSSRSLRTRQHSSNTIIARFGDRDDHGLYNWLRRGGLGLRNLFYRGPVAGGKG
jgi:putative spermidine/putrescine transport system permease protein